MKVLAMQAKLAAAAACSDLQIPSTLQFAERMQEVPEPVTTPERTTTKRMNRIIPAAGPFASSPDGPPELRPQQLSSQQQSSQPLTSQQHRSQQRSSPRLSSQQPQSKQPSSQQSRSGPRDSQAQIETVGLDAANAAVGVRSTKAARAGSMDATTKAGSMSPMPMVGAEPLLETLSAPIEPNKNQSRDTVSLQTGSTSSVILTIPVTKLSRPGH